MALLVIIIFIGAALEQIINKLSDENIMRVNDGGFVFLDLVQTVSDVLPVGRDRERTFFAGIHV